MTILRAEKLPNRNQSGFVKSDIGNYMCSTNVFGSLLDNDFVEWDWTNISRPIIRIRSTWGAAGNPGQNFDGTDNLSVARAFPTFALGGLFGNLFDIFGYNQSPRLIDANPALGDRGYIFDRAPAADLQELADLTGFPVRMTEFPSLQIDIDADIGNTLYNNVLVDMYANYDPSPPDHYISDGNPLNDHIQSQFSKHLNLQVQMDWGKERSNSDRHARGYSGARELGEVTIDGQRWRYGHKFETLGENNFPFISFAGWDGSEYVKVTSFNAQSLWRWVIDNWGTILTQADAVGVSYEGVTQQTLRESYCDGVHAGSEILGPGIGDIVFNQASMVIGAPNTGTGTGTGPTVPTEEFEPIPDSEFQAWLRDARNDPFRLFIAEIDHGFGSTLRVASRGWLSDTNQPYYERLPETPIFRQTLAGRSAGSMIILNPNAETDRWTSYDTHGHSVRWFIGDERWLRREFRRVLTTQSRGVPSYESPGRYRFGLVSDINRYRINIFNSSIHYDDSAGAVVNDLIARASGIDPNIRTFRNIGGVDMSKELRFDVDEDTVLDSLFQSIATSLNAWRRISQDGALEFVSRDNRGESTFIFNQENIEGGSLRPTRTIDPVRTVIVPFFNGSIEAETNADIQDLSTSVVIDSLLKNRVDAEALGQIEAARYSNAQATYIMTHLSNAEELNVGNFGILDHVEIGGNCFIGMMERRPLEDRTVVEVTI